MKNVLKLSKGGNVSLYGLNASWKLHCVLNDGAALELGPSDMKLFEASSKNGSVARTWKGCAAIPSLEAREEWTCENGYCSGRMSFRGLRGKASIEKIRFPIVELPLASDCQLVAPQELGFLIMDAAKSVFANEEAGRRRQWSYLNPLQMQFCAFLSESGGVYFDARDSKCQMKDFAFFADGAGRRFYESIYLPPEAPAAKKACALPYRVGVKSFKGSWHEAAQIYREWALRQSWARKAPRKKLLDNVAAWVWNRGGADETLPPVERLRKDLGLPVALDWYWWHRNPYDTEYPRYLPPRDGVAKFKNALRRMKAQGILSQVYVNGMLWDLDDESWRDGGDDAVIMNKDGSRKAWVFNPFTKHRLAFICGESEVFRQKILRIAKTLRGYGLDSLYLDVFGEVSGTPCYNPKHKHAPGGGRYHVEGFRKTLKLIRKECHGMALSAESCPEAYIDLLESGIVLSPSNERIGWNFDGLNEQIPLFNAVYHELFAAFGSYACIDGIPPYDEKWPQDGKWKKELPWHELYPDQFPAEISRCVVWGMQPMLVNLRNSQIDDPKMRKHYEFFLDACKFRYANRDALLRGRMLPPGELEVEKIHVDFLFRMVFTKEDERKTIGKELPGVLHSRWETKDGRRLLILANFSRKSLRCRWSAKGARTLELEMPPRSFKAVEI